MTNPTPDVRYFSFFEAGEPPRRADQSAGGTIPVRAYRYCEAIRVASGAGHYLFPPTDLMLAWDGRVISCSLDGEAWMPVADSVQFPGFPEAWDAMAPDNCKGAAPPYLTALPEPGFVQINLGVIAATKPGWALWLGGPINFPMPYPMDAFCGVVDTSIYRGPLFINFRITRNEPFRIYADRPLVQVIPMRLDAITDKVMAFKRSAMTADAWEGYHRKVAVPNRDPNRTFGTYAVEARKANTADHS
jgi:hypothetical protein